MFHRSYGSFSVIAAGLVSSPACDHRSCPSAAASLLICLVPKHLGSGAHPGTMAGGPCIHQHVQCQATIEICSAFVRIHSCTSTPKTSFCDTLFCYRHTTRNIVLISALIRVTLGYTNSRSQLPKNFSRPAKPKPPPVDAAAAKQELDMSSSAQLQVC